MFTITCRRNNKSRSVFLNSDNILRERLIIFLPQLVLATVVLKIARRIRAAKYEREPTTSTAAAAAMPAGALMASRVRHRQHQSISGGGNCRPTGDTQLPQLEKFLIINNILPNCLWHVLHKPESSCERIDFCFTSIDGTCPKFQLSGILFFAFRTRNSNHCTMFHSPLLVVILVYVVLTPFDPTCFIQMRNERRVPDLGIHPLFLDKAFTYVVNYVQIGFLSILSMFQ